MSVRGRKETEDPAKIEKRRKKQEKKDLKEAIKRQEEANEPWEDVFRARAVGASARAHQGPSNIVELSVVSSTPPTTTLSARVIPGATTNDDDDAKVVTHSISHHTSA